LRRLQELGAELEEMDGAPFDIEPIWRAINHTTWRARFAPMAARHADQMSPSLLRQLASASDVSGVDCQSAMFARTALFRHVQTLLSAHDFIVTPTLSRTAPPVETDLFDPITIEGHAYEDVRANWYPWTMPFNLTGHPAVSMPTGFGDDGLPIGLQVVGRFRADAELLGLAALYEAATALLGRWPEVAMHA
jgi:aspartyl-tRNA(Asn)/glutamyl-tRNA(Gln) amidotransferase subunit A